MGTDAYNRLHGIVNDGKTLNTITLVNEHSQYKPTLTFPVGVTVVASTERRDASGSLEIRKGFADSVEPILELGMDGFLHAQSEKSLKGKVIVRYSAMLRNKTPEEVEGRLGEIVHLAGGQAINSEWGLNEYVPLIRGEPQFLQYIPINKNFKAIDGTRMWIGCSIGGTVTQTPLRPFRCTSSFNYKNGLAVTYTFTSEMLPQWREIYDAVLQFTDSILVSSLGAY